MEISNAPETVITPQKGVVGVFNKYKNRLFNALEQVFVDEKDVELGVEESLDCLWNAKAPKYDKAVSVLRIARNYLPSETQTKVGEKLAYSQEKMPFSLDDYQLKTEKVGFGGVNDVFLLDAQKVGLPSYVLKVNRLSTNEGKLGNLITIAKHQKDEYEEIASAFKSMEGLIPQEHYVVIHGPRKGTRVVVMIQQFVGEKMRDIFVGLSGQELEEIVSRNNSLREQLQEFLEVIHTHGELVDNEIDLRGENNLVIVGSEGHERLLLMDPHFRSVHVRDTKSKSNLEGRLKYLEAVVGNTQEGKSHLEVAQYFVD